MSSKYGERPVGTDGSDHWHRESIAWQYKQSSIFKWRLKFDVVLHVMIAALMFVRLLPGITSFLGLPFARPLRQWNLPPPKPWEYAWFISIVTAVIGWKALPKNERQLIKQYLIGTVVFGILPVIYGLCEQTDDMYTYLQDSKKSIRFLGYPAVIIFYMFLAIAAQIHIFGIYFALQLYKAWKPRSERKKVN